MIITLKTFDITNEWKICFVVIVCNFLTREYLYFVFFFAHCICIRIEATTKNYSKLFFSSSRANFNVYHKFVCCCWLLLGKIFFSAETKSHYIIHKFSVLLYLFWICILFHVETLIHFDYLFRSKRFFFSFCFVFLL